MRTKAAAYNLLRSTLSLMLLAACNGGSSLNTDCDVHDTAIESDIQDPLVAAPQLCFPVGDDDGSSKEERCFYLLLPDCAKEKAHVSFVIDLHDRGSCPLAQSRLSGWKDFAIEECFVVAWPLGITDPEITDEPCFTVPGGLEILNGVGAPMGVAPDCCCQKDGKYISASETNDVTFLHTLISVAIDKAASENITVNATSVRLTGLGNGATAAMGFSVIHSDVVACLAPFSGAMVTAFAQGYKPVPIFSVLDTNMPYEDQELSSDDAIPPANGTYLIPSPGRTDGFFSVANGCGESTSRSNIAKDTVSGTEGVVTGGKFVDCVSPVNFLQPPYAAYKSRSYDQESTTSSSQPANYVVDSTGLAILFCSGKHSLSSAYMPSSTYYMPSSTEEEIEEITTTSDVTITSISSAQSYWLGPHQSVAFMAMLFIVALQ